MNIDSRFNEGWTSFSPLNPEFSPENRLIDTFSNHFSFHSLNRNCESNVKNHLHKLKDITLQVSSDLLTAVVVTYMSIKNHITTSIAHIHSLGVPIIKTIYYTFKVLSIEAELFAIRCGINQAIHLLNIKRIMVMMDFLHVVRKIFDFSIHPYQIQSAAISYKLREFFKKNTNNSIEFWNYSSHCN